MSCRASCRTQATRGFTGGDNAAAARDTWPPAYILSALIKPRDLEAVLAKRRLTPLALGGTGNRRPGVGLSQMMVRRQTPDGLCFM